MLFANDRLGMCWRVARQQVMLDDTLEIVLNGRLPALALFLNNRVRCTVFLLGQGVPRATNVGTMLRGTLHTRLFLLFAMPLSRPC